MGDPNQTLNGTYGTSVVVIYKVITYKLTITYSHRETNWPYLL